MNSNSIKCLKNKKLADSNRTVNIIEHKVRTKNNNDKLNESGDSGNASIETPEINIPLLMNDNFEMSSINQSNISQNVNFFSNQ